MHIYSHSAELISYFSPSIYIEKISELTTKINNFVHKNPRAVEVMGLAGLIAIGNVMMCTQSTIYVGLVATSALLCLAREITLNETYVDKPIIEKAHQRAIKMLKEMEITKGKSIYDWLCDKYIGATDNPLDINFITKEIKEGICRGLTKTLQLQIQNSNLKILEDPTTFIKENIEDAVFIQIMATMRYYAEGDKQNPKKLSMNSEDVSARRMIKGYERGYYKNPQFNKSPQKLIKNLTSANDYECLFEQTRKNIAQDSMISGQFVLKRDGPGHTFWFMHSKDKFIFYDYKLHEFSSKQEFYEGLKDHVEKLGNMDTFKIKLCEIKKQMN